MHLSGLECGCCPGRVVCLHHADTLCECKPRRRKLVFRYTQAELDQVGSSTPLVGGTRCQAAQGVQEGVHVCTLSGTCSTHWKTSVGR